MDEPLSKSEERFIETSPLALGLFRIAGPQVDLVACSPSFASYVQGLVGTKREDFLSLLREDCFAVDFEVIKRDYDVGRLSLNGTFQTLFRLKDNTGHFAPFSAQGKLVNESGDTQRLYLFLFPVDGAVLRSVEQKEEEERQSQLFDEILSTTKTAIFWKDAQRRFLGANTAFLDYYGFATEAAILGKNDEDMGWHSDPDPYKNDELRVLKEGISTFRVPGKCFAKGEERNIVASKSPLIVGGKIIGLVGSFEDVTLEVRHKEEIAKLNEELTRRVYEHERLMATSAVAIATIHLPDLSLVEANDSVYEIMGLSREEAAAKYHHSLSEFFVGESHQELDRFLDEVHRAVQQKKPSFSFSFHFPQVKGSLWVSGAGSFSAQDPSDVVVVYRDATDIMETQRRLSLAENEAKKVPTLSQENARLNSMIDGVPSGLGTLQIIDGVPADQIQLNQFFFSRIDVPSAQNGFLSVSAFPECLHPDDRENFVLAFKNLLRDKHLVAKQFRFRNRANGAYTWSSVRALITTISPHVEVAYFVFTDIQELKKAEKGLRESQYFYRQAVKAAGLKTWTYNLKDHSVSMSDGDYYGTEMESWGVGSHVEDVPKTILPLIDPADRQKLEGLYQKVDRGESASAEVWFSAQPGREPHCERITYFFPGGTASDKAIGLGQNITAEKKVAERYKREIEYLRASDDSNLLAKGHYNLTQKLVIGYSTKKEGLFVAKEGTRYTDAIQAFFDLPYREEEREELKKALNRDDLLKNSQLGDVSGNVIYRRKIPGAMPIWLSLSYHTYMMPETGDVELFCYGYDVSEKMESVEIMRIISKTEFDYIGLIFVEGGGFEFIEKDPKILFPEVRKIIPFESFRDFEKNTFISDENRSVYDQLTNPENILSALKTSDHYLGNYLRNEAGKIHCKKLDCAWLDKEAKILLMVRSDVTELYEKDQEQLQAIEAAKLEAEKANEAKSAFLSNMSHDLRTPLNGVIGFTDLALKESDPQKKQDYLEKINSSGKLLLDLINDTLELSRIESGKSVNEPEACDPKEVLPPVLTALRPSAELKKITLESSFSFYPNYPLWCDRLKIQKIALNLLSNAIKYTPVGGKVVFRVESSSREQLIFDVEDNGIGMSQEFMAKMYEPFSQEKRSESVNVPGTGLGLSIVKKFVDLLGGSIAVESQLHRGSHFRVVLPIKEAEVSSVQKQADNELVLSVKGKRLLLCEDNPLNQEIATMLLKERGFVVDIANDGEEGVRKFSSAQPGTYAAILMDVRMPRMDGLEATKAIRALKEGDGARIPIIAMTADAFEENIKAAEAVGMNGYITKPILPEKMFAELSRVLK